MNILLKNEENYCLAHCLDLDIVVTAKTREQAQSDLGDLIAAQVQYAFENDNLDSLVFPAPEEYWRTQR